MSYTLNRMQTHWPVVKDFIKHTWPLFTDVELNRINGDFDLFAKYYNTFYGDFPKGEARARDQIQNFINQCEKI